MSQLPSTTLPGVTLNVYATAAAILGAVTVGFILGLWLRPFLFRPKLPISKEQIKNYMAGVVSNEELLALKRSRAISQARSGRRTTRTDSGPSAKVYRMRIRKNVIERPIDRTQ